MMELIKEVWSLFNPASINMDFEQAAIQSAILVFPESQISGCLFHLVKNFKKKIREVGLTTRYREPEFSVRARMIMSLAFVPPATIWDNFELLRTYLLDNHKISLPSSIGFDETMLVGLRIPVLFFLLDTLFQAQK
uniref:MULE transposase domain-containing protein n=1 Tax=Ditylenchus dipsaci TaxID=166011 RepID=A0A915DWH3_9BILA